MNAGKVIINEYTSVKVRVPYTYYIIIILGIGTLGKENCEENLKIWKFEREEN